MIFWVAAVFLLPVSPIWPPRRPFLPYGRPNLALAGILVFGKIILKKMKVGITNFAILSALCAIFSFTSKPKIARLLWLPFE